MRVMSAGITTPMALSMALVGLAAVLAVSQVRRLSRQRAEDRHRDERLDDTLDDSFPASDPPPF